MMVRFLSIAERELTDAFEYYDGEKPGLGLEFMVEVEAAIQRIVEFPEARPKISDRVRRCRTRRFPFGVLYQLPDEEILVVAIMDLRRDSESWKDRT